MKRYLKNFIIMESKYGGNSGLCGWSFFLKLAKVIDKIVRIEYNNSTKEGSDTMSITATELKNNLGKYLVLSATEDIFITRNGKIIAKLTNPHMDRVETAKSLFGILPKDADLEDAKAERLGAK